MGQISILGPHIVLFLLELSSFPKMFETNQAGTQLYKKTVKPGLTNRKIFVIFLTHGNSACHSKFQKLTLNIQE